ncbi:MAG: sigma-70 family RNA polymerase sigma factor [bacterium]|nr:sigma-70 family RNA polymerase sigma factor [bacterium]
MDAAPDRDSAPGRGAGSAPHAPSVVDQVYDELRTLARAYLSRQRPDHTLQPTALVHEAYLRLLAHTRSNEMDRAHLFCSAARAMRSVLVDHARRRGARKRRGGGHRIPLDDAVASYSERAVDLVALDDILHRLGQNDPDMTTIIELRFFGGLSEIETAEALDVSPRTVRRKWQVARTWLHQQIGKEITP